MIKLTVIIVSYNTKELTRKCIQSTILTLNSSSVPFEIIIVDNASSDGSQEMLNAISEKHKNMMTLIKSRNNVGFSKANNQALEKAKGTYVLYLNSDTEFQGADFKNILDYLDSRTDIGALTIKVLLPTGKIDWACHRGSPTIWRSFCYFSKLEAVFGSAPYLNKIFGGYHLRDRAIDTIHQIDSPSGAFYLSRKNILDKLNGFDTRFFMYGEDLDLSLRIKKLGYRIVYYPKYLVIHHKYQSGIKKNTDDTKNKTKKYFFDAMKLYYEKHHAPKKIS